MHMGFFGPLKKVTPHELKRARWDLRGKLNRRQRNNIEREFQGDLNERGSHRGITEDEIKTRVDWLKKNKRKHTLSDKQIDDVDKTMRKYL